MPKSHSPGNSPWARSARASAARTKAAITARQTRLAVAKVIKSDAELVADYLASGRPVRRVPQGTSGLEASPPAKR